MRVAGFFISRNLKKHFHIEVGRIAIENAGKCTWLFCVISSCAGSVDVARPAKISRKSGEWWFGFEVNDGFALRFSAVGGFVIPSSRIKLFSG